MLSIIVGVILYVVVGVICYAYQYGYWTNAYPDLREGSGSFSWKGDSIFTGIFWPLAVPAAFLAGIKLFNYGRRWR